MAPAYLSPHGVTSNDQNTIQSQNCAFIYGSHDPGLKEPPRRAQAILWLASAEASFVTGTFLDVAEGNERLARTRWERQLSALRINSGRTGTE
ncbi:protein of unknown function [Pseudomonas mediterranea]